MVSDRVCLEFTGLAQICVDDYVFFETSTENPYLWNNFNGVLGLAPTTSSSSLPPTYMSMLIEDEIIMDPMVAFSYSANTPSIVYFGSDNSDLYIGNRIFFENQGTDTFVVKFDEAEYGDEKISSNSDANEAIIASAEKMILIPSADYNTFTGMVNSTSSINCTVFNDKVCWGENTCDTYYSSLSNFTIELEGNSNEYEFVIPPAGYLSD